ncbi:MAG: UDP-N-acetylglucosamine 2-epimerase [Lachnospiraceae bacterium]|nr:UDP-N-acetylglucosamine 2-epimerase [Lachnospiraceae bacterium]
MKKIAVVTSTRADYGILTPLVRKIYKDTRFELELLVTGTHLSEKYGNTQDEIIKDGFPVAHRIQILEDGNTPYDISLTMANAIKGFAEVFRDDRPDIVIILGDRTEILAVASAAMNEQIPIAHLHGGEITEGAVDDCVRHAITKMSYLHFTSTEVYRKRVIQLGEDPCRVYNVGALSTENILQEKLLTHSELRDELNIPGDKKICLVTFHPVTLEYGAINYQMNNICTAMSSFDNLYYLITMPNADAESQNIIDIFKRFVEQNQERSKLVANLGMKRYLSAVKDAAMVLGNSSSGIVEAPVLGTPTVNIGDRQRGRLRTESIIDCTPEVNDISNAMKQALKMPHVPTLIYGDGNTSNKIIEVINKFLKDDKICLKKKFYDINFQ